MACEGPSATVYSGGKSPAGADRAGSPNWASSELHYGAKQATLDR